MTRLLFLSGLAAICMILGGLLPLRRKRWPQQALLRFMAFGSGVLLGAAFLHIIPEAVALSGSRAGLGLAGAFVAIFAVEQVSLAHACPECAAERACRVHPMGWIAFSALGLHSLVDGLSIAAGFAASEALGVMAAVAVLIHKVPTGSFVYVGASDILPRLHEERSLPVFSLLVLGVAVTWVVRA